MTHTLATLEVSAEAYDEIAEGLVRAGYHHAFLEDGLIDMYGIGLMRGEPSNDVLENLANEIAGGDEHIESIVGKEPPEPIVPASRDTEYESFPLVPDTYPCVCYFNAEHKRDFFVEEASCFYEDVEIMVPTSSRCFYEDVEIMVPTTSR